MIFTIRNFKKQAKKRDEQCLGYRRSSLHILTSSSSLIMYNEVPCSTSQPMSATPRALLQACPTLDLSTQFNYINFQLKSILIKLFIRVIISRRRAFAYISALNCRALRKF